MTSRENTGGMTVRSLAGGLAGVLLSLVAAGSPVIGWELPFWAQRPVTAQSYQARYTGLLTGSITMQGRYQNKPSKEEDIAMANLLVNAASFNIQSDMGPSPVVTYEDVTPVTNIRTGGVTLPDSSLFLARKQIFNNFVALKNNPTVGHGYAINIENLVDRPKFIIKEDLPVKDEDIRNFVNSVVAFQRKTPFQTTQISTPYNEALTDVPVMVEYQVVVRPFQYILPFVTLPYWVPTGSPANIQFAFRAYCEQSFTWATGGVYATSNTAYKIVLRDRTPPRITDLNFNQGSILPLLSGPGSTAASKATTNDYYRPTELRAVDNISTDVFSRFGIHHKSGPTPPGVTPQNGWQWVGNAVTSVSSAPIPFETFLPNDCLGEMKYTAFVWDDSMVMNPGESQITENRPDIAYGIRGTHAGTDLGNSPAPNGAQPFPVTAPADPTSIDIDLRIPEAEGTVFIDDNDFPNLMLRITSAKDKGKTASDLLLPPPPGTLSTFDRPVFDNFAANAKYTASTQPRGGFVKFLAADLDNCPATERTWQWQFGIGLAPSGTTAAPDFAKNAFALENFARSDTDSQGILIDGDSVSFAERNGFGKSVTVFCEEPLIEDVEYEIALWAEDNCKWINLTDASLGHPSLVGAVIPSPFTGIESAGIKCVVPNQYPRLELETRMGSTQFVSDTLRVTMREPTSPGPLPGAADAAAWSGGYPSIEGWAKDFKGNERRLKVYFQVTDEKVKVRIMEQKHLGK